MSGRWAARRLRAAGRVIRLGVGRAAGRRRALAETAGRPELERVASWAEVELVASGPPDGRSTAPDLGP